MQRRRDSDRVAVEAEIEGSCDRHLDVSESEAGGQRDRKPFRRGKSLVDGHDQRRCITWRNETYAKRYSHFSISDAARIDCAISPIFFFSRIAVERSKT